MARKKAGVIQASSPATGADDLQVIHPHQVAILNGRQVTVREYGFVEGLQMQPRIQPFLDDLYTLTKDSQVPSLEQLMALMNQHLELVLEAVAQAADVELAEIKNLQSQMEGRSLLMAWWAANGPFYFRCVLNRLHAEQQMAALAGVMSTHASSDPDTEISSESPN